MRAPDDPSAAEFAEAVVRRDLTVHYQPQVHVGSGGVPGIEALVRWEHPRLGLLHPHAFLGLAEQTGLLGALTDQVLEAALAFQTHLAHRGHIVNVSVNVDASSLLDPEFPERIVERLRASGVAPSRLTLEVTEHSIMHASDAAATALGRLRSLGVGMALDDFGTGYSSLARLHTLPVDQVKIDRSFVSALGQDGDVNVLRMMIDLGRRLDHEVVAEGAETASEAAALAGMGCDLIQGYHFSEPLPGEELIAWLERRRDQLLDEVIEWRSARLGSAPPVPATEPRDGTPLLRLHSALDVPLRMSASPRETAAAALAAIGGEFDCGFGAWWRIDDGSGLLRAEGIWAAAGVKTGALAEATLSTRFAAGVGLAGEAWSTGDLLVDDELKWFGHDPRLRMAEEVGASYAIALPLRVDGEVSGVLELFAGRPFAADGPTLHALRTVGDRVGQHIRRQEAEAEAAEALAALEGLGCTGRLAVTMAANGTLRSEMCARVGDLTGAETVFLYEPSADGATLELTASTGWSGGHLSIARGQECSAAASAFESGTPRFMADVATNGQASPRLRALVPAASALFQPVSASGRPCAVLAILFKEPVQRLSRTAWLAVQVLADQLAVSLRASGPAEPEPPAFVTTLLSAGDGAAGDSGATPGRAVARRPGP